MTRHDSNTIIKFADDTTVVCLITYKDETAYREVVRDLTVWCQGNNLWNNLRKRRTEHSAILIDVAVVE